MTELPIDENTPRILIVEDEPKLGQLLIDYLRAASYAPSLIGHGDQVSNPLLQGSILNQRLPNKRQRHGYQGVYGAVPHTMAPLSRAATGKVFGRLCTKRQ